MSRKKVIATIDDMRILAQQQGGKCLSKTYESFNTRMVWQCEKGHIWETRPLNIKKGAWWSVCARVNQRNWNRQASHEE